MKRHQLIQHLTKNGCIWDREGSNHTIYYNPKINKTTAVPRHNEIKDTICNEICKQIGVPKIK
ncbi:MAG: type II toxin-antitoxin system HicA family toxin [Lentimicrobiaceae bacterium]|nr:type II toxin-antitoxin system HicA family toxin [Lentimicrobiaceae bacterium]